MKNFIKSMLGGSDTGVSISTTRVITIVTAFSILGIYVAQNIMAMVKCGGYIDFPANSVMALLVVMGAKVGQAIFENKKPPENKPTEDKSTDEAAGK